MYVDVVSARLNHYRPLTELFSQSNAEHLEMRSDMYRRVENTVPPLKFAFGVALSKINVSPATILVAEEEKQVLGAIYIEVIGRSKLSWSKFETSALIDNTVVRPEFRRRGIGLKLVKAATEWARERGHLRITANTLYMNDAGRALFGKAGFGVDYVVQGMTFKR